MKKFGRLTAITSVAAMVLTSMGFFASSANAQSVGFAAKPLVANIRTELNAGLPNQQPGFARTGSTSTSGVNITYQGGEVLTNTVNVYVVWYGKWDGATTDVTNRTSSLASKALIQHFLTNVGNSSRYNINKQYYKNVVVSGTTQKVYVNGQVNFVGETVNTTNSDLSDAGVQTVTTNAIAANTWKVPGTNTAVTSTTTTADPNGLYFVLTSAGINETSGFLTNYCGWHSWTGVSTPKTKFSFVGDPSAKIGSCAGQSTNSPNTVWTNGAVTTNLIAADAMMSVILHELEETATDAEGTGWYFTSGSMRGYENADACAWKFGTVSNSPNNTSVNPSKYNLTIGGKNYLVQMNWKISTAGCANN